MKIRYTRLALSDLEQTRAYIARDRPKAAEAVVERIRQAINGLSQFPQQGRVGRVKGTRELVVPGTPFVVPYRIADERIDILAVMHGARAWPESF